MRFFFCLILFSYILVEYSLTTGSKHILCTSRCSPIIASFSNPLKFATECQQNNNGIIISDPALVCSVEYRVNHVTQQIQIQFQGLNETNKFEIQESSELFLQSISISLTNQSDRLDETTRTYFCNTKNDCARDLYLKTIEYLINNGTNILDQIKAKLFNSSLIMGPASHRRCIDSDKTGNKPSVLCRTGLCYAHYRHGEFNETQSQKCHSKDQPVLVSEIEHYISSSTAKGKKSLEYWCNKNVCNRNDMINTINDFLDKYTYWNTTAVIIDDLHIKQATSFAMKSIMSSSFLVLNLILIQFFF